MVDSYCKKIDSNSNLLFDSRVLRYQCYKIVADKSVVDMLVADMLVVDNCLIVDCSCYIADYNAVVKH